MRKLDFPIGVEHSAHVHVQYLLILSSSAPNFEAQTCTWLLEYLIVVASTKHTASTLLMQDVLYMYVYDEFVSFLIF